jgi:ribosome biogenesis GTPase A
MRQKVHERKEKVPEEPVAKSKEQITADLNSILKDSDILLEVLDARSPLDCRIPDYEKAKKDHLILVLNKVDLLKSYLL